MTTNNNKTENGISGEKKRKGNSINARFSKAEAQSIFVLVFIFPRQRILALEGGLLT